MTIALCRRQGRLCALIALLVITLSGCNGSSSDTFARMLVGPEGGTVVTDDGLVTLAIPPNALTESTEISIRRERTDEPTLFLFEMSPSGTVFNRPARLTVDVSSIIQDSDAEGLVAGQFPTVFTTTLDGTSVEVLENLQLLMDSDQNTVHLGGDVSHFSGFVVGGKTIFTARIDKVPFTWPENSNFGPVELVVAAGSAPRETAYAVDYSDTSVSPVAIIGEPFQTLFPVPRPDTQRSYPIPYRCGPAGEGTFAATVRLVTVSSELVWEFRPIEVDIASAFLFGITGAPIEGGESVLETKLRFKSYVLSGTRTVNCTGSAAPEEPTPAPTMVPEGEATPTPVQTPPAAETPVAPPEATPTPQPTAEPFTISSTTSSIVINHTVGQTECPTNAPTVVVETSSAAAVNVSVSENLPFLTVNRTSATTANGRAEFVFSFPCSGFSIGENRGTVTVVATDPATGQTSNTLEIPVVVTVTQ